MNRKYFTKEELQKLRENPYTEWVSAAQIRFTEEFQKEFWRRKCEGATHREALEACGYDYDMLGKKRIEAVAARVKKEAARGWGTLTTGTSCQAGNCEARVRALEEEVSCLRHQMDWVKKVMSVRKASGRVTF